MLQSSEGQTEHGLIFDSTAAAVFTLHYTCCQIIPFGSSELKRVEKQFVGFASYSKVKLHRDIGSTVFLCYTITVPQYILRIFVVVVCTCPVQLHCKHAHMFNNHSLKEGKGCWEGIAEIFGCLC